jgi:hypothetical protein
MRTLAVLVVMVFAALAARAAACNRRHFRAHDGRPPVLATEDEIKALEPRWSFDARHWPPPRKAGEWALDPGTCAMYARLVREQTRRDMWVAEVVAVVGGAWLGVTLAGIPDLVFDYVAGGAGRMTRELAEPDAFDLRLWVSFLPIVLILLGAALRHRAMRWDEAHSGYLAGARRQVAARVGIDGAEADRAGGDKRPGAVRGALGHVRRLWRRS